MQVVANKEIKETKFEKKAVGRRLDNPAGRTLLSKFSHTENMAYKVYKFNVYLSNIVLIHVISIQFFYR